MPDFIDSLESRNLFAIDFAVTITAAGTNAPRYVTPGAATKFTTYVGVGNSGDTLPKTAKPADVKVVLHPGSGADIVVGTVKAAQFKSLKAGSKSKLFKVSCMIPKTATTEGNYSLTATFDGSSISDTQPLNDSSIYSETVTITANPPGPLDIYNLGSKITFTKTGVGEGNGVGGAVHELGTFTDTKGHSGNYEYSAGLGIGSLYFDFNGSTNTPDFFVTSTKLKTLKGTYTFSSDSAKSVLTMKDVNEGASIFMKK